MTIIDDRDHALGLKCRRFVNILSTTYEPVDTLFLKFSIAHNNSKNVMKRLDLDFKASSIHPITCKCSQVVYITNTLRNIQAYRYVFITNISVMIL